MKIAITTSGTNLEAPLDARFGRAPGFLIYDTIEGKFEVISNKQNLEAVQGAGIQAAQNVAAGGAEAVITGHCGPKAFRVLKEAGIAVYNTQAQTVTEALQLYLRGELQKAEGADVEGHW